MTPDFDDILRHLNRLPEAIEQHRALLAAAREENSKLVSQVEALSHQNGVLQNQLNARHDDVSFVRQISPDSRVVYISSSQGSDDNDGSRDNPIRSFARARRLVRSGFPDHLLLRRGDTFSEHPEIVSGRSSTEPFVLGAYGDGPAPVFVQTLNVMVKRNVVLMGFDLVARTVSQGLRVIDCHDVLIQDVNIVGFTDNLVVQSNTLNSWSKNIKLRGVVSRNAFNPNGKSQGLFAKAIDGLTVEFCRFDANGWKEGQVIAEPHKNHNVYIQEDCKDVVFRNCVSARACATGLMIRCGGVVLDCVLIDNPIHLVIGGNHADILRVTAIGSRIMDYNKLQDGIRGLGFWIEAASGRMDHCFVANGGHAEKAFFDALVATGQIPSSRRYSSFAINFGPIRYAAAGAETDWLVTKNTVSNWVGDVRRIESPRRFREFGNSW